MMRLRKLSRQRSLQSNSRPNLVLPSERKSNSKSKQSSLIKKRKKRKLRLIRKISDCSRGCRRRGNCLSWNQVLKLGKMTAKYIVLGYHQLTRRVLKEMLRKLRKTKLSLRR